MNILGIETSCDETAAAVVADGSRILSNVVASQADLHTQFGGVVPEVAARSHIESILPVIEKAMDDAFPSNVKRPMSNAAFSVQRSAWDAIDAVAVTQGPGLLGSLLIGTSTAASLALVKAKQLVAVDHVEAHLYGALLDNDSPPTFPILALIVSGGHTQLVLWRDHLDYRVLGVTQDDAAGEAFDKVARLLGLPYPGGPALSRAAESGDDQAFDFPKAKLAGEFDFSFSGLKTAVLRQAQRLVGGDYTTPSGGIAALLSHKQINDLAASFQKTAVDELVGKTEEAFEKYQPKSVVVAGGVAANQLLRQQMTSVIASEAKQSQSRDRHGLRPRDDKRVFFAPPELCTDNAAMIAALGFHYARARHFTEPALAPDPILKM